MHMTLLLYVWKRRDYVYCVADGGHKDIQHQFLYKRLNVRNTVVTIVNKLSFLAEADSLQGQSILPHIRVSLSYTWINMRFGCRLAAVSTHPATHQSVIVTQMNKHEVWLVKRYSEVLPEPWLADGTPLISIRPDTNLHCKTTDMETVDWLLGEVYCPTRHITAHVWGWTARILL